MQNKLSQKGFTLLLTIIVISVVLAVTMSSLNVGIKQVRLSADTRDSEVAFHAANAGLECLRFWRRGSQSTNFENGNSVDINCFDSGDVSPNTRTTDIVPGAHLYEYQIEWGDPGRCSQMRFIVMTSPNEATLEISDIQDYLPGYPTDTKECPAGGRCTAALSQGYSTGCPNNIDDSFPLGTIQREIFVEF